MLVFIDESGKPHPKDSTENPVLCAVCIKERDIKQLSQKIFNLKMKIFGKDTEVKSTSLIRRRILSKNMTNNKQYVDEFVKIACSFDIRVFAIIMEKPDTPFTLTKTLIPRHYKMIISRVEYFCEKHNHEKAILVFDVINPGEDFVVAKCITNFLFMSKLGKGFNHILEMPFFVNSEVTPAIQIADIYAGIIRHYYENGLDLIPQDKITEPFELWVNNLFLQIKNKTENYKQDTSGFIDYGLYKIGKKF
ncbi:MAG: DUF3800 domain-containing protein [Treponema sp.]|nr:DUF3800 domain-containing protein [Treponema sp.]